MEEKDLLRDTPLRLSGYANEVGESFRHVFPRLVTPSYAVAYGYVLCDTMDKTYKTYKSGTNVSLGHTATAAGDTLLWQLFASVLLPGLTVNRLVYFSSAAVDKAVSHPLARRWLPVAVGLSSIPFIVSPIDDFTDSMMNRTYRSWTGFKPVHQHKYASAAPVAPVVPVPPMPTLPVKPASPPVPPKQ